MDQDVQTQPHVSPSGMTKAVMVLKYRRLRDLKKAMEAEHKKKLEKVTELMLQLEGWLLEALNADNLNSFSSEHGTAYKSHRTTAKVTDWSETLKFIQDKQAWDLLEARVSKTAAFAIVEETKQPIPGVETTSEVCVNVRSPSGSNTSK